MKMRATIIIDFEASDYIEAGQHERQLRATLDQLRGSYPEAVLDLRERRSHVDRGTLQGLIPMPQRTRRIIGYDD